MKKRLLVLGLVCISFFLSEIMLKINATMGFLFYTVVISWCMIAISRKEEIEIFGMLILSLMILPVMRVAELFISFDFALKSLIVYCILSFLVLFYSIKFRINPGLTKAKLSFLPLAILIGATIGLIGSLLFNFELYNGLIFILPVIVFAEEMLFRGVLQNLINWEFGGFSAVFFTSLMYGIFSLGFGIPIALFFFGASIVLSFIYQHSKNIFLTMALSLALHLAMLVLA